MDSCSGVMDAAFVVGDVVQNQSLKGFYFLFIYLHTSLLSIYVFEFGRGNHVEREKKGQ